MNSTWCKYFLHSLQGQINEFSYHCNKTVLQIVTLPKLWCAKLRAGHACMPYVPAGSTWLCALRPCVPTCLTYPRFFMCFMYHCKNVCVLDFSAFYKGRKARQKVETLQIVKAPEARKEMRVLKVREKMKARKIPKKLKARKTIKGT